jgi:hypothetical protein
MYALAFCDGLKITIVLIFGCVGFAFRGRTPKEMAGNVKKFGPTYIKEKSVSVKEFWPQKYYFIEFVAGDDFRARCKIYDKMFLIFQGGQDITRHAADPIHKTNVIRKNTNKLMTS